MKFKELKRQSGLTLIEVVAAVTLMGTLLCLVTRAYRQQWQCASRARIKLAAIRAADRLLAEWASGGNEQGGWTLPVPAQGQTNVTGLNWKTRWRETPRIERSIIKIDFVPFNAALSDASLLDGALFDGALLDVSLSNTSRSTDSEQLEGDADSAEQWLNSQVVQLSIVEVTGGEEKVILAIEFLAGIKMNGATYVDQLAGDGEAKCVQATRPDLHCFF